MNEHTLYPCLSVIQRHIKFHKRFFVEHFTCIRSITIISSIIMIIPCCQPNRMPFCCIPWKIRMSQQPLIFCRRIEIYRLPEPVEAPIWTFIVIHHVVICNQYNVQTTSLIEQNTLVNAHKIQPN